MRKIVDITGQKFNNLTVIKFLKMCKASQSSWLFRCDCGNEKILRRSNVLSNRTKDCGCKHNRTKDPWRVIAGMTRGDIRRSRFERVFCNLRVRCNNKNCNSYKNYGGRGIKVCERWSHFKNFYDDMYESYLEHQKLHGGRQTTIDRIDNDGDYSPENCRWATMKEQMQNQRNYKGISKIIIKGKTLFEWSSLLNIKYSTLLKRVERKWNDERIITPLERVHSR